MDVSAAIVAKSDQLNAIDLVGRDVTITIVDVKPGDKDQPVHIITDAYGTGRPWKPSKTALRDIVQAWGTDSTVWVGRRITIFNDPEVLWAGQPVGGIRIRAMSHIDKAFEAKHIITRGKTKKVMIQPLADAAPVDGSKVDAAHAAINQATTTLKLDEIAAHATRIGIHNQVKDAIEARRAELG
ncbi:hypothetical protein [Microbacterium sp. KSW4-4]|uniref:hypothetical protein n=1 Tax=Microbacterium sp. KSW4-4 TaxID=2851651 RepID=UPI001FFD6310|nr:hypothetical protein [Microbacterium sp. KSW4-4]MCK2034456.1 hypothetical protein [Microbacterium sp. KSW4-4]